MSTEQVLSGYNFVEYVGRGAARSSDLPRAAIYRGATNIALNAAAIEALGLVVGPQPGRIVYLYDAERRTIGIRKSVSGEHSYPVNQQTSSRSSFNATIVGFLKRFGLPRELTLVWSPATAIEGFLILPLDDARKGSGHDAPVPTPSLNDELSATTARSTSRAKKLVPA